MVNFDYDCSGWATKANTRCYDGLTIAQDAFKECDGKVVPMVYNHDHGDIGNVIGHCLLENRPGGVYCYAKFNDTDTGRTARKCVESGDLNAFSIFANGLQKVGKTVKHGFIREVSLVLAGCNPGAIIDEVIKHSADEDYEGGEAFIISDTALSLEHGMDPDGNPLEELTHSADDGEHKQEEAKMKKRISMAIAVATAAATMASVSVPVMADDVNITIFNSKMEVQSQFEELAAQYAEETGVGVEVYYNSDTVSAHLATRYSANDPYTISMVDPKDIYSLAADHAIDLSDQSWVNETDYAIGVDGQINGFPTCLEARGVIYNADAIEAITGETFNPDDYKTLDSFKELLEKLKEGGMETPTGIMKEDWSLAAHFLAEVYEQQPDVEAFVSSLYEGTADLANNEKFNSLMDFFDVMMENNYAKDSAIAAERETTEMMLAEGQIAFMFGGNWDWSVINAYDYTENMGMMPVPQNTDDGSNEKLVGGGSKFMMIDSSDATSDEQRQAAKDFLTWLADSDEGQSFIAETCALVPAFSNNEKEVSDPLGKSVKKYADEGSLIDNYNYLPDDHLSICGATFQKYLAGQIDRAEFAAEIEDYWKNTTPVEH